MTHIELLGKPKVLEAEAFYGCFSLSAIALPDTIEKIDDKAFCRCVSLSSVHIPRGLTELGEAAFMDCKKLHSVSLPTTLKRIDDRAFEGCSNLHTVLLPDCNTSIGRSIFASCDSLSVLVLPEEAKPFLRRRRERWEVRKETQIILHSELKIALLFAELADADVSLERKQELRALIRRRMARMKHRNHLHSTVTVRQHLSRAVRAIGEQLESTPLTEEDFAAVPTIPEDVAAATAQEASAPTDTEGSAASTSPTAPEGSVDTDAEAPKD